MTQNPKKIRSGVRNSLFPTTPLLLSKTRKRNNILVGDDPAQERFAEQLLGVQCKFVPTVQDDDLLGQNRPVLLRVEYARSIELSTQVRSQTDIWSLDPIEKGSAGANAIVRHACKLLGIEKPNLTLIQRIADLLCEEPISDIKAAVWHAAWLLTGPMPDEFKPWSQPWNSQNWLPINVDPQYRLNSLYRDFVGVVFARQNPPDWNAAQKFFIKPTKFNILKNEASTLDLNKVRASIKELSRWRLQKYNPLICALKITAIWSGTVS